MKRFLLIVACLVCAVAIASPASAVTLTLDYMIGTVEQAEPADETSEEGYVQNLIDWYNAGTNPNTGSDPIYTLAAGTAVTTEFTKPPFLPDVEVGSGTHFDSFAGVDETTSLYLLAKFGNDSSVYWLNNLGDITAITSPFSGTGGNGGGLSHITLFNTREVPEGATLMLLGFGLAGVGTLRRFMKR